MIPCEDHELIQGFVLQTINLIDFYFCGAGTKTSVMSGVN